MQSPADAVLITQTLLEELVLHEHARAVALYPQWRHPYGGLRMNRARRSYGQAHRDGTLVLSRIFLGTPAFADLEDTVRHEFAHLIVGIDHKHGPAWKQVASALGATPRATGRSRDAALAERMHGARFTLVAIMESGEARPLRRVYRRSRRLSDYRPTPLGRRYHIDGEWIVAFRYDDSQNENEKEIESPR
jgi:hypothetical protein